MAYGGFRVHVDNSDITKALERIQLYSKKMPLAVENAVSGSAKAIARGGKQRVRVKSGKLKKSIGSSFDLKKCEGKALVKMPHAHLIEFGVAASMSKATKKKSLKANGKFMGKSVRIPARRAFPFMKPAYEAEKPVLLKKIKEAVQP